MSKGLFLIEDHDEALKVWRQKGFKNLDLVHIDAHIDFGFYQAKPIDNIIREAKNLKELKSDLERSLAYKQYENDFDKQVNIGNYIYPAMIEGIVKDFYWVIPGGWKEFKESKKFIRGIIKNFAENRSPRTEVREEIGIISAKLWGRKFVVCVLEKLPILRQKVLLDIDTDFLVIDSIVNANNTANIGKRKPWILPKDLVYILKNKIKHFEAITIAYSVNGGYTPVCYKVLGDELAYRLSPRYFKSRYAESFIASVFFERFTLTGKKEDYQKATKLNPSYRAADNNYGFPWLSIHKFSQAKKEFLRIAKVDPKNPYPFIGLGNIALEKRDFYKAKNLFSYALKQKKDLPFALFGLAQAEFKLKNFKKAKGLLWRYQALQPLQSQSYYFLGCIYENEKDFQKSLGCYQDALRLGINNIDIFSRVLKICHFSNTKSDIIKFIAAKYKGFKKRFIKRKQVELNKSTRGQRIGKQMAVIEQKLALYADE